MFNVFTPLAGGSPDTYLYPVEYPFDFDAGLDFTRPATGIAPMPFPVLLPYVSGFTPLLDGLQKSLMAGKTTNGAGVNMMANPAIAQLAFPSIYGGLAKVKG